MAPISPPESASLTPSLAEVLYHQAVDGLAAGDLPDRHFRLPGKSCCRPGSIQTLRMA